MTVIFDIRTVNEKVTEVFIGPDWSRSKWIQSENIKPKEHFDELLSDFEKKISAKQKMISKISPSRTPSRFISNLAINSAVKRRNSGLNTNSNSSASEDENAELNSTPLKKMKIKQSEMITNSPLSVRSTKSTKSTRSTRSNNSAKSTKEILMVNSGIEEDVKIEPETSKSTLSRCIIM